MAYALKKWHIEVHFSLARAGAAMLPQATAISVAKNIRINISRTPGFAEFLINGGDVKEPEDVFRTLKRSGQRHTASGHLQRTGLAEDIAGRVDQSVVTDIRD
jgi:hypothetical protein